MIKLTRDRESLTLNRRRRELAEHGQAYVMTSFVRSAKKAAKGDGRALLDTMKAEWQAQHAVVIFYPRQRRTRPVLRGRRSRPRLKARHRMRFDFRNLPDKAVLGLITLLMS